jgi:hypothetical protein
MLVEYFVKRYAEKARKQTTWIRGLGKETPSPTLNPPDEETARLANRQRRAGAAL